MYPQQELCASGMPQTAMWPGMSLRDHFAGMALSAILKQPAATSRVYSPASDLAARVAYQYADAMIAERNKWPHCALTT